MIQGDELYHYGVKGMKWGVRRRRDDSGSSQKEARAARKQAKAARKVEYSYAMAGTSRGKADHILSKGRKEANAAKKDAREFEQMSKDYASKGKKIRSKISGLAANHYNSKAADAMRQAKENAEIYVKESKMWKERAEVISSDKNVNLGKNRINDIVSSNRKASIDIERRSDEIAQRIEERYRR